MKYLVNYPSKINQAAFLLLYCKAVSHKFESTKIAASKMLLLFLKGAIDEVSEKELKRAITHLVILKNSL